MKKKKMLAARFLATFGLREAVAAVSRPSGILVLNYHRIGDGSVSPYDRELWSASAEAFEEQLAFLGRHCDVISPADIEYALQNPRNRYAIITFDDGYRDNYEVAFPILQSHRMPATFFVSTGFVDRQTLPWWDEIANLIRLNERPHLVLDKWLETPLPLEPVDRSPAIRAILKIYKSLPLHSAEELLACLREESGFSGSTSVEAHWMDWDMIREMDAKGMTIGGHTMHHPVLSRMSREQQRQEIGGCAARIQEQLGKPMEYFSYPVGHRDSFNADTQDCLRALGVRYAFSYYGGFLTKESPVFDMPRVAIEPHINTDMFRAIAQLPNIFSAH